MEDNIKLKIDLFFQSPIIGFRGPRNFEPKIKNQEILLDKQIGYLREILYQYISSYLKEANKPEMKKIVEIPKLIFYMTSLDRFF
jgi:hypothetical protein